MPQYDTLVTSYAVVISMVNRVVKSSKIYVLQISCRTKIRYLQNGKRLCFHLSTFLSWKYVRNFPFPECTIDMLLEELDFDLKYEYNFQIINSRSLLSWRRDPSQLNQCTVGYGAWPPFSSCFRTPKLKGVPLLWILAQIGEPQVPECCHHHDYFVKRLWKF